MSPTPEYPGNEDLAARQAGLWDRGLIISPGRVDELTKAMNEMLDGKSEFYSQEELMTYVQYNASLMVIGKRFSDIYTKMGL